MREIILRGRSISTGNWVYGDLIQLLGQQGKGRKFIVNNKFGACIDEKGDFINTEAPFVIEVDPGSIGQYTGLKDRNGKDIYESDILSNGQHIDWIVIYDEGSFKVKHVGSLTNDKWVLTWEMAYRRDVIGNIYEHPHLLEGERSE